MIDPKDTRMDELDEAGLEAAAKALACAHSEFTLSSPADRRDGIFEPNALATEAAKLAIRAYLRRSTIGGEPVGYTSAGGIDNLQLGFSATIVAPAVADEQFNRPLYAHPAPSTGEGVKVKALEWEEVSSRIFDAKGVCGLYRVKRYDDHWAAYLFGSAFNAERSTADEAKAAAQADYEARIRSALE